MSDKRNNECMIGIRKSITCTDGLLKNLFTDDSVLPNALPVGVVRQISKKGRIQERAQLHPDAIGVKASFVVSFKLLHEYEVSLINNPLSEPSHGFILKDFKHSLKGFIDRAKTSNALRELTLRYVRNITTGKWLNENRMDFNHIELKVTVKSANNKEEFIFIDHEVHRHGFNNYDAKELKIAHYLEQSLRGDQSCILTVSARLIGDQRYVYASEDSNQSENFYLMKRSSSTFPNTAGNYPLEIFGEAILFDKEISSSIQSIDTWDNAGPRSSRRLSMRKNGLTNALFDLDSVNPKSDQGLQLLANIIHGFSVPLSSSIQ